jgi:SAM-dependent methyltransferase
MLAARARGALCSRARATPATPASIGRRAALLAGGTLLTGASASSSSSPAAAAATTPSKSPYERVLQEARWPEKFPLEGIPDVFSRYDESDDAFFYDQPRFVTHIDDGAIKALTAFYEKTLTPLGEDAAILDICSSWISHYPESMKAKRVAVTGLNEAELKRNSRATEYHRQNLNKDLRLPYDADSFDAVTCVVSIDYLTDPLGVMREMHRVLKPGGAFYVSFSNRMFSTKAVRIWVESGERLEMLPAQR